MKINHQENLSSEDQRDYSFSSKFFAFPSSNKSPSLSKSQYDVCLQNINI